MIMEADLIYALGSSHLFGILEQDRSAGEKASLLGESAVMDPIGGNLETYRECADKIERRVRKLLENL